MTIERLVTDGFASNVVRSVVVRDKTTHLGARKQDLSGSRDHALPTVQSDIIRFLLLKKHT